MTIGAAFAGLEVDKGNELIRPGIWDLVGQRNSQRVRRVSFGDAKAE
jgi:hypothetical protein